MLLTGPAPRARAKKRQGDEGTAPGKARGHGPSSELMKGAGATKPAPSQQKSRRRAQTPARIRLAIESPHGTRDSRSASFAAMQSRCEWAAAAFCRTAACGSRRQKSKPDVRRASKRRKQAKKAEPTGAWTRRREPRAAPTTKQQRTRRRGSVPSFAACGEKKFWGPLFARRAKFLRERALNNFRNGINWG